MTAPAPRRGSPSVSRKQSKNALLSYFLAVSHRAYALPRQGIPRRVQLLPLSPARAVRLPLLNKTAQSTPALLARGCSDCRKSPCPFAAGSGDPALRSQIIRTFVVDVGRHALMPPQGRFFLPFFDTLSTPAPTARGYFVRSRWESPAPCAAVRWTDRAPAGRAVSYRAYALPRQGISHRAQPLPLSPARAVRLPMKTVQNTPAPTARGYFVRSRWESNPRAVLPAYRISSATSYDHLSTAPTLFFAFHLLPFAFVPSLRPGRGAARPIIANRRGGVKAGAPV